MKEIVTNLIPGEGSVPLVVIVGETASGKSALAMEIARDNGGEIICADSRTVYTGMDIGTAKPTPADQARVPHHCLDLVRPDKSFTVADFQQCAAAAIDDITSRGKLPILVGGTGLYVDAILYDFTFRGPADLQLRQELQDVSVEELQQKLLERGIALPENSRNPRHLIRALETNGQPAAKKSLRQNTLILGLSVEREELKRRIEARVEAMVAAGLVEEVRRLSKQYGWDVPAMQSTGYKAFRGYLEGSMPLDEAKALFIANDLNLAKRQRTWFRRNNSIQWLPNREE